MKHCHKVHTSKLTSKTCFTFSGFGEREGDNTPTHVKPATTHQHPYDVPTGDRTMSATGKDTGASSTLTDTNNTLKHLSLISSRKTKQFVAFGLLLLTSIFTTPVSAQRLDICDRTPQVQRAIIGIIDDSSDLFNIEQSCGTLFGQGILAGNLAAITSLDLSNKGITSLKSGDFDNLIGLDSLRLQGNPITTPLPAGPI